MKILISKSEIRKVLKSHIKKFGHRPEHHPWLYLYALLPGYDMVYFDFGNRGGVVTHRKNQNWHIVDEPLASPDSRVFLFLETAKYIFSMQNAKKINLEEWTKESRDEVKKVLLKLPYRLLKSKPADYWPVFDLERFDEKFRGKNLKGLRYVQNRFLKNHKVAFKDASKVSAVPQLRLLKIWSKRRTAHDKVWDYDYEKFMKAGFPGCSIKRALFIDGVLRGISAGWQIPNSNNYYIYLDIHDYSDEYLGEFLTIDHFLEAKKRGFKLLDFGGSDKGLLNFKKKFHPAYIYETYDFSIARK